MTRKLGILPMILSGQKKAGFNKKGSISFTMRYSDKPVSMMSEKERKSIRDRLGKLWDSWK